MGKRLWPPRERYNLIWKLAIVLEHNGFTESHEKGLVIKKVVNVLREIFFSCLGWLHFEGLIIY
jgi:hypothetical protein